jgi:Uncharacterized conserved protein (DUF2303)
MGTNRIGMDRSGDSPKLIAVLDYHRAGADGAPRFGRHRSLYEFPFSKEWQAWVEQNTETMGQAEFAQWIEDRIMDILDPGRALESAKSFAAMLNTSFASPAKMLEISQGLELHVGQRVKQAVRLASGETTIQFDEQHTDAGGALMKVPGAVLLGIPIFQGGDPFQVPVRLRYRTNSGSISWSFEMHRADHILDFALDEACTEVAETTGLDVLEGTPEA